MGKKTTLSSSSEDLVEEREELMVCPSETTVSLSEIQTTNTKSKKKKRKRTKLSLPSSPPIEDLVEEREEFMVSPSGNNSQPSSTETTQPCVTTSVEGSALRNHSDSSPPDLKALSLSVSLMGWRFLTRKFKSWARKMSDLHEPTWRKAGIFEAVAASAQKILKDTDLVVGIAEKWCPDTKTFVFPWGETTITLEDVMVLLGFSVLGSPVFATLDSPGEKVKAKLEKEWLIIKKDQVSIVTQAAWMRRFMDSGDELEHVAFLVLWLSYFVFPSRSYHLYEAVFPIAIHLSSGTRIALAPAVLAHLYAELSLLKHHIRALTKSKFKANIDLTALFKLVQVWTWERFRELQPEPNQLLEEGQPILARWANVKQGNSDVWQILDNAKVDSFEWRPYTKTVKTWEFPKFYPEKEMWVPVDPNLDDEFISFARCIKVSKLVGMNSVENYFPTRVASQFGLPQDVPALDNGNNLSHKAAWTQYDKPIVDLKIFIPSRSTVPCVTSTFCEWWRKSLPQFQYSSKEKDAAESAKPLKPRNIVGHDTYNFVPPGDNMSRTSGVGINISEYSTKKRQQYAKQARDKRRKYMNQVRDGYKMKRTREDAMKIANDSEKKRRECMKRARDKRRKYLKQARDKTRKCMKRVCENDDEEDDHPTISQMVRLMKKKKYSDVTNNGGVASEPLGKKSRLEADNNDSGPPQKHASIRAYGDETVPPPEIEQRKGETDEIGSKAGKNTVLTPIYENFSSDAPLGFNEDFNIRPLGFEEESDILVPALRQTCDDERDVYGSNIEKR